MQKSGFTLIKSTCGMNNNELFILQINAGATHGGASGIAVHMFQELAKHGYTSKIATSCNFPSKKNFLYIPPNTYTGATNPWERTFFFLCRQTKKLIGKAKGAGLVTNALYNIARPSCLLKNLRGVENFENYPGTQNFFANLNPFPNIIHCHNLHGLYFDLRILPVLCKKVPVIITLHDEWMYTGHCTCTLNCSKWQTGCDNCPNLSMYVPLWRDTSAYNIQQKASIYKQCQFHLITPSQWLMNKAKQSILTPAIKTSKIIHNGIDLTLFKPGNQTIARNNLKLPLNAYILLFIANQAIRNPSKDYTTLEKALLWIAQNKDLDKPILVLCTDECEKPIKKNNVEINFIGYINGKKTLAKYYQTADLLIHATKNDNFPTTVLESLACGIPVIGSYIGGVPEQINEYAQSNHPTGMLYQQKDYKELASKILFLLTKKNIRQEMSKNARIDAKNRFDIQTQITKQIEYYHEILKHHKEDCRE